MKKYNITVNGNTYEVIVEEIDETNDIVVNNNDKEQISPQTLEPAPKFKKEEKPQIKTPKEPLNQAVETEAVNAPMPGSIFEIKVSVGDNVLEGDTLLILEAMKMENEIMAPKNGKIVEIKVSKGQTVDTGDLLISLD